MNTTLIVDGNWLLMSRLFAVKSYFNVQNDEVTKHEGTAELEDLLCKSINLVINKFDNVVNNIIIVSDGGSWRNKVKKPDFFDEKYKGNRVKSAELDWKYIYQALDDIVEKASELGITTSKAPDVEGDDWVAHWSRKLNAMGTNCIIWSSDCDLKQLVSVNNGAFTCWFNEQKKSGLPGLVLPNELQEKPLDDIDMFMQIENTNRDLDEIRSVAHAVTYIDPSDIVEEKVICGDKGDNIKSLIRVERGTKTYRISSADWQKTKEKLRITTLDEFFKQKREICECISSTKKYQKFNINNEHSEAMFDYNKILVWLNVQVTPKEILEKMDAVPYKKFDLSYIKSNYKTLLKIEPKQTSVEEIFDAVQDELPF